MNPQWIAQMKYIMDNLIEHKTCSECFAHWFCFDHEGNQAFYRLGEDEPHTCDVCRPIDEEIESQTTFVSSHESWVKL